MLWQVRYSELLCRVSIVFVPIPISGSSFKKSLPTQFHCVRLPITWLHDSLMKVPMEQVLYYSPKVKQKHGVALSNIKLPQSYIQRQGLLANVSKGSKVCGKSATFRLQLYRPKKFLASVFTSPFQVHVTQHTYTLQSYTHHIPTYQLAIQTGE